MMMEDNKGGLVGGPMPTDGPQPTRGKRRVNAADCSKVRHSPSGLTTGKVAVCLSDVSRLHLAVAAAEALASEISRQLHQLAHFVVVVVSFFPVSTAAASATVQQQQP